MGLVESRTCLLDIPTNDESSYEDLKREWLIRNHIQVGVGYPGEWLVIGLKVERPGQRWNESKVGLVAHSPDYRQALDLAVQAGLSNVWLVQVSERIVHI